MKDVKNYKGIYKITKDGKVWSAYRKRYLKGHLVKGYPLVDLVGIGDNDRKRKFYYVHRLVAEAYIPKVSGKLTVNHKNGIKTDNRVENLEWCTQKENIRHSWAIGTSKPRYNLNHPSTKISEDVVSEIRAKIDFKYGTMTKLAKEYGVSISLVSLIGKGYRNYA